MWRLDVELLPAESCLLRRILPLLHRIVPLLHPWMLPLLHLWILHARLAAGQALSRPLRRLLQASGAVLLRLGGRRGDLWLRAYGSEVLSASVPPHGLVPAAGVRSEGGQRGMGQLLRAAYGHFGFHSLFLLLSRSETKPFISFSMVTPAGVRTPDLQHLSARPSPRAPLACSHR